MGNIDFSAYGGGARYHRTEPDLLMASAVTSKIYLCDAGEDADGTPFTASLIRESLPVGSAGPGMFQLSDLWPDLESDGSLAVRLGVQRKLGDAVIWGDAHDFDPAIHAHFAEACTDAADLALTGRYISIHFESDASEGWTLLGYSLEFEPQGKY